MILLSGILKTNLKVWQNESFSNGDSIINIIKYDNKLIYDNGGSAFNAIYNLNILMKQSAEFFSYGTIGQNFLGQKVLNQLEKVNINTSLMLKD